MAYWRVAVTTSLVWCSLIVPTPNSSSFHWPSCSISADLYVPLLQYWNVIRLRIVPLLVYGSRGRNDDSNEQVADALPQRSNCRNLQKSTDSFFGASLCPWCHVFRLLIPGHCRHGIVQDNHVQIAGKQGCSSNRDSVAWRAHRLRRDREKATYRTVDFRILLWYSFVFSIMRTHVSNMTNTAIMNLPGATTTFDHYLRRRISEPDDFGTFTDNEAMKLSVDPHGGVIDGEAVHAIKVEKWTVQAPSKHW